MSAGSGPIRILINDRPASVAAGTTVAAAVCNSGSADLRRSVRGEPRGPLCGMGICLECRATIDGVAHERTCMIECSEGMAIRTAAAERAG